MGGRVNHEPYPDTYIRSILSSVKTIAMVGASANSARPSYLVLKYLSERGYRMLPINPGLAGGEIHGLPVYASLREAPVAIDMVEIFRNSAAAGAIVDEALELDPLPRVIWMQLSVRDNVVMNRCPKIEYGRLSGEIKWSGVNSRIISSRKPTAGAGFQRLTLGPR